MNKIREWFQKNALSVLIIGFLTGLYFLLNFRYVQQLFDWDQIVYSNNILNGLRRDSYLFNPHHLHFELTGGLFHHFVENHWGSAGFTDVIFNLRLRSLLTACVGMIFGFFFIRNLTGKNVWAVLGTLLIVFSHGYLSYATKVDTPIFPAVAMILLFWFVERSSRTYKPAWLWAIIGGILIFIAVMFHQYMLVAGGLACLTLVIPPWFFPKGKTQDSITISHPEEETHLKDIKPARRYIVAILSGVIGISLVVAAYYHVGIGIYEFPVTPAGEKDTGSIYTGLDFQLWLFALETVEGWGTGFKEFHPEYSLHGFTVSFLAPDNVYSTFVYDEDEPTYDLDGELNETNFAYNHIGYLTFAGFILLLVLFPGLYRRYGRHFLFVLLNFGFYSAFTTYWEAHYYEFWLIPNIGFWLLIVMIMNLIGEKIASFWNKRNGAFSRMPSSFDIGRKMKLQHGNVAQIPFYVYAAVLILILFAHNSEYHLVKYCRYPRSIGIKWADWEESYYKDLYSDTVYNHPDDPYGDGSK